MGRFDLYWAFLTIVARLRFLKPFSEPKIVPSMDILSEQNIYYFESLEVWIWQQCLRYYKRRERVPTENTFWIWAWIRTRVVQDINFDAQPLEPPQHPVVNIKFGGSNLYDSHLGLTEKLVLRFSQLLKHRVAYSNKQILGDRGLNPRPLDSK